MVYENLKEICKEKHITFQEIEVAADLGAGIYQQMERRQG